jgi:hypothetical protein
MNKWKRYSSGYKKIRPAAIPVYPTKLRENITQKYKQFIPVNKKMK